MFKGIVFSIIRPIVITSFVSSNRKLSLSCSWSENET